MSGKTKIEWTEATWNCITGCTKVSQGCRFCYAEREWPRLAAPRAKPNIYTGRDFTDVKCHPEKLVIPWRWAKPRRIFVNSMSDLFHESVPFEFIASVFAIMGVTTRHTYQVLTKRPERMLEFFRWVHEEFGSQEFLADERIFKHFPKDIPWESMNSTGHGYDNCGPLYPYKNVWLGVSCEDQATADERIPLLLPTPAAVRWVSAEPLLGPINLRCIAPFDDFHTDALDTPDPSRKLQWIVAGGESGPQARPMHPEWVRSIRDQCQAAGALFFFKQWGEWEIASAKNGHHGSVMPETGEKYTWIGKNGKTFNPSAPDGQDCYAMAKVGKKRAGRLLDGRTWDEYPE